MLYGVQYLIRVSDKIIACGGKIILVLGPTRSVLGKRTCIIEVKKKAHDWLIGSQPRYSISLLSTIQL